MRKGIAILAMTASLLLFWGCGPDPEQPGVPNVGGKGDGTGEGCPEPGELFRAIRAAVAPVLDRGTLPAGMALSHRNRAGEEVLIDPPAIFAGYARLVREARHEVNLSTFTWDLDTDPARTFLGAIGQLEADLREEGPRARPVVVRFLLNTSTTALVTGGVVRDRTMRSLAAALQQMKLDPKLVTYELSTHTHVTTASLHSKMLIVDGRKAFITGANMGQFYDFDWGEHDAAFAFEGEVARSLLADFDDAWAASDSWNTKFCGLAPPWPLEPLPEGECIHENKGPPLHRLPELELPDACAPMLVVGRPWRSGLHKGDHDNPQDQAFLAALRSAKQRIRIRTPNLNVDAVEDAIVEAILQRPQLQVQIVLAKGYEDLGERFDGGTNVETVAELYGRLLAAGIDRPCERLQIRWYSHLKDGETPVEGKVDPETGVNRPSHVKYASFDGEVAIVGSANMDNQSWSRCREVNVVVDDPHVAARWDEQLFGEEYAGAVPVDECRFR